MIEPLDDPELGQRFLNVGDGDKFYIQLTNNDGIWFWSTGGLMELWWQATKFDTREEVDAKRKQLQAENPDAFVQWKRLKPLSDKK